MLHGDVLDEPGARPPRAHGGEVLLVRDDGCLQLHLNACSYIGQLQRLLKGQNAEVTLPVAQKSIQWLVRRIESIACSKRETLEQWQQHMRYLRKAEQGLTNLAKVYASRTFPCRSQLVAMQDAVASTLRRQEAIHLQHVKAAGIGRR